MEGITSLINRVESLRRSFDAWDVGGLLETSLSPSTIRANSDTVTLAVLEGLTSTVQADKRLAVLSALRARGFQILDPAATAEDLALAAVLDSFSTQWEECLPSSFIAENEFGGIYESGGTYCSEHQTTERIPQAARHRTYSDFTPNFHAPVCNSTKQVFAARGGPGKIDQTCAGGGTPPATSSCSIPRKENNSSLELLPQLDLDELFYSSKHKKSVLSKILCMNNASQSDHRSRSQSDISADRLDLRPEWMKKPRYLSTVTRHCAERPPLYYVEWNILGLRKTLLRGIDSAPHFSRVVSPQFNLTPLAQPPDGITAGTRQEPQASRPESTSISLRSLMLMISMSQQALVNTCGLPAATNTDRTADQNTPPSSTVTKRGRTTMTISFTLPEPVEVEYRLFHSGEGEGSAVVSASRWHNFRKTPWAHCDISADLSKNEVFTIGVVIEGVRDPGDSVGSALDIMTPESAPHTTTGGPLTSGTHTNTLPSLSRVAGQEHDALYTPSCGGRSTDIFGGDDGSKKVSPSSPVLAATAAMTTTTTTTTMSGRRVNNPRKTD